MKIFFYTKALFLWIILIVDTGNASASKTFLRNDLNSGALVKNAAGETLLLLGVSAVKPGPDDLTAIFVRNTKTQSDSWIKLPEKLASEHIVGIFSSTKIGTVFLLTQLRKAGLSQPTLSKLDLGSQKISLVEENVDCANIEETRITKGIVALTCGDDPHFAPKSKKLKLQVEASDSVSGLDWKPQTPNSHYEAKTVEFKIDGKAQKIQAEALTIPTE